MLFNWKENKVKVILVGVAVMISALMVNYFVGNTITSQAFINAPVISVRAPIPGRTSLQGGLIVGKAIGKGERLAVIEADTENPRVSQLHAEIAGLEALQGSLKSELQKLAIEIQHRESEYEGLQALVTTQASVDTESGRVMVSIAKSALKNAQIYEQEAKRNYEQATELLEGKHISQIEYDHLEDLYKRAHQNTLSKEEEVNRAELSFKALNKGLQIDGTRTLPYVVTRSRTIEEEVLDLKARSDYVSDQVTLYGSQIEKLQSDLLKQRKTSLVSPVSGVVWDIVSNNGDAVSLQAPVLKVVDCSASWVEAFMDESIAADMKIGETVRIEHFYGNDEWEGEVESIRYGTGRVTVGQYLVDPPPEVMRRQLPVRVASVKINVDWSSGQSDSSTCNVGSSVEIHRS